MNAKDGVCAYVAGGLGNQLFILAAAWEQAQRLGVPLYLDTSFGTVKGTRPFELDSLPQPGIILGRDSPWTSVRLTSLRVVPFPRAKAPLRRRVFLEKDAARFDPSLFDILPGTTLFGYFQSGRYFPSIGDEMRDVLLGAPETPEETDILQRIAGDPRITVHLRRGDYLAGPADMVLLASTDYVARSRDLLADLGEVGPLRVFSDSPDMVRDELAGLDADIEIVGDDGSLSPINTVKAMASGTAFVMSNSSFSWWAAWLMQQTQGPERRVIAPRPWDATGTAKADLLQESWITLEARSSLR